MRILHLLASPWWTGPAENVALLALAQRSLGHEVSVAIDRLRTQTPSEEPAVPRLRALGLLDESGLELSVKSSPIAVLRDLRRLRARALDVVHSHFTHDHVVAWLGRPRGARLVRSIHAPRSLRRLSPPADGWTVPVPSMLRRLLGRRVAVLPPLLGAQFVPPVDRAAVRKELGIEGDPLVGMVSAFQPSRRHALGMEAFRRLRMHRPGAHLLLVGDGALLGSVRAQAETMGLAGAVTFAGYRSGDDFVRRLQALDTVWILGLGNDWSGRAACQAGACGVRVVAVDEGGLPFFSDETVPPDAEAVAVATLSQERAAAPPADDRAVARAVLALYRG